MSLLQRVIVSVTAAFILAVLFGKWLSCFLLPYSLTRSSGICCVVGGSRTMRRGRRTRKRMRKKKTNDRKENLLPYNVASLCNYWIHLSGAHLSTGQITDFGRSYRDAQLTFVTMKYRITHYYYYFFKLVSFASTTFAENFFHCKSKNCQSLYYTNLTESANSNSSLSAAFA